MGSIPGRLTSTHASVIAKLSIRKSVIFGTFFSWLDYLHSSSLFENTRQPGLYLEGWAKERAPPLWSSASLHCRSQASTDTNVRVSIAIFSYRFLKLVNWSSQPLTSRELMSWIGVCVSWQRRTLARFPLSSPLPLDQATDKAVLQWSKERRGGEGPVSKDEETSFTSSLNLPLKKKSWTREALSLSHPHSPSLMASFSKWPSLVSIWFLLQLT